MNSTFNPSKPKRHDTRDDYSTPNCDLNNDDINYHQITYRTFSRQMNFRTEAIQAIGRIVNARAWCLRNNRGKYLPASVTAPVINQYRAHKTSWSARGVARFIIRYENNLRRMATGGNQQQQLISKLILEAYHYESKSNNSPARLESRQRVFYDSYQKRIQQIQ